MKLSLHVAAVLAAVIAPAVLRADTYAAPDGAFAIALPTGWSPERDQVEPGIYSTTFRGPRDDEGPVIEVVSLDAGTDLTPEQTKPIADALFPIVIETLTEDGRVTSQRRGTGTFAGRPSQTLQLEFTDGDGRAMKGTAHVVVGKKFALLASAYGPKADEAELKAAEAILATLAVESRTPLAAAGRGETGGSVSTGLAGSGLRAAAADIRAGLNRPRAEQVLEEGDPPLTYASVSNWVQMMEIVYGMQFTELEFQMTVDRFREFYRKQDAEGKRILATTGESLLRGVSEGTPAEIEKNRAEIRQVTDNALRNGAEQGIEYAVVLWGAIERRQSTLARTEATAPEFARGAQGLDQTFSDADLDATVETLYFMWVASGRDPSQVTEEAILHVRQAILGAFDQFPRDVQYLLCNAERWYSGLRGQWQQASAEDRLQMAVGFGQFLDSWGLTEPGAGGDWGAWDGGGSSGGGDGEYGLNAQIAQNTAFLASNTWQRTNP